MFRFMEYELTPTLRNLTFASIGAIMAGRVLNIYVISFHLNQVRWTRINGNIQHMLFLSGFKGVMAYALSTDNPFRIHGFQNQSPFTFKMHQTQINAMVTIIILIITVAWAGLTLPLLKWLHIPLGK